MAHARLLEEFLNAVRGVHATRGGTQETSYYTALNNLLDGAGQTLKPKVCCVMQLKNLGAGNPDGGLFTADQFDRQTSEVKDLGQPARGVIEVKAPQEPVDDTAATWQITKYWDRYKLVLVSNLRDWLLIGEREGQRVTLERFRLAANEAAFWALADHPAQAQTELGDAFADFLTRVLLHNAPLADPKDLAALLASYAREARHRVEHTTDLAARQLAALQQSLESSLGVTFNADEGGHFFRSTLVQTLFYGVFSAWVLRRESTAPGQILGLFDWKSAAHSLNVPMIAALFGQLSQPAKLKALNLAEVLDWAADALNRVDQAVFFKTFESTRSIQYFYEPFLAAFDPELRKSLGVWYTPEEIVRYQVARVDQVLQSELGLPDGLADPNVVVLDPCCGTGAYLVEVLRVIAEKLNAGGADALAAHQLKLAATTRLFGFELLPAPYVVAHLQLGLLLRQLGAPLGLKADGTDERAGIYLTNALTGWDPAIEPKTQMALYPEFEDERDAADHVKQSEKIIVILGNPPYRAFGGVALGEEQDLIAPYKVGLVKKWGIKKFNLDDLYVRFFRLAERRIAERGQRGVVCFISNSSYVREPSFVVMREHLVRNFDRIWIDNLNGDSRETGKTTPDGQPDPSVFSTAYNKEGIRKGVAIALLVKRNAGKPHGHPSYAGEETAKGQGSLPKDEVEPSQAKGRQPRKGRKPVAELPPSTGPNLDSLLGGRDDTKAGQVRYREWWSATKRKDLLNSVDDTQRDAQYAVAKPETANRHSLRPGEYGTHYQQWPSVPALAIKGDFNGPYDARDEALYGDTKKILEDRFTSYFNAKFESSCLGELHPGLANPKSDYDPVAVRKDLMHRSAFDVAKIRSIQIKPFDRKFFYGETVGKLCCRPSPDLLKQADNNFFFITRSHGVTSPEGFPVFFAKSIVERDALRGHARHVPFWLETEKIKTSKGVDMFASAATMRRCNLSTLARQYLATLGLPNPDTDQHTAELIWMHALAIGYSPAYLAENADGIRENWPRIPLPASRQALLDSAALGRQVAALLDTESAVPGVTSGSIRAEFKSIAVVSRIGGGALKPAEFALTAGWGSGGQGGITMPGKGKTEARAATPNEQNASFGSASTQDVYLNATAYWKNIPQPVWDFTIGGYQVIKKWLSYREQRVLGRALTLIEIMEVTAMARRLAALVLLQPQLDDNYRAAAADTWALDGAT
ncbi:MAG: N-6 DNA methylase [Rhodoferax sp.]|jgi:hypothetical protein|nr:N-6 DNA methylase [Rhodoferax sp.]